MTIIANPSVGEKCPVHIVDLYISKLPVAAKEKDIFYCRALQDVPKDASGSWFAAVPIGKNTLTTMVSDMCKEAGVFLELVELQIYMLLEFLKKSYSPGQAILH